MVSCKLPQYISYISYHPYRSSTANHIDRLSVPDLTPNVGIFWYYFVEMFDHFRPLFLVVFQLNALLYALPITYRLQ
jgi:hypothetical protein